MMFKQCNEQLNKNARRDILRKKLNQAISTKASSMAVRGKPNDDAASAVASVYDPPYNKKQMMEHGYTAAVIKRLLADPAHSWRMKSGIELIHRELTRTELERIWNNWQLMTDKQKALSDAKCMELFGVDNKTLYEYLMPQYKVEQPGKDAIRLPNKQ